MFDVHIYIKIIDLKNLIIKKAMYIYMLFVYLLIYIIYFVYYL